VRSASHALRRQAAALGWWSRIAAGAGSAVIARCLSEAVAVPISSGAGLPAQVKTPDDVLRYGKDVIARFRD